MNAHSLAASFEYLTQVLQTRISLHFGQHANYSTIEEIPLPSFDQIKTPFTNFLSAYSLNPPELILLLIALAPHMQPDFYEQTLTQYLPREGDFPQLGGTRGKQFRGFLPTGETALFVLAGDELEKRFQMQELLGEEHFFFKKQVLYLEPSVDGEPLMSGRLIMSQEFVDLLTIGKVTKPRFNASFPAQLITTQLDWEDLVLDSQTLLQINELRTWVIHGDTLLQDWGMRKKLKMGYRALFHGPPGTGKTLTASLLGKYTGRDVYKIDLSLVVSKFIGETEKNLAALFAKAESKGWILFFDEADALFGKRTNVRDAHDKYANQEVSYLLQRVENFDGLAILASNFKTNIDEAFMRRFQSIIHFPMPKPQERLQLWENAFPAQAKLASDINLKIISQKYEISGASIMNIVQYCCLQALSKASSTIQNNDLIAGIQREFSKDGKII
ncbi:MAG: superfamily ATPase [Chitinophagaceae bacterium]|nr:superfamily ATPase [Chitinophagaceae bacterium]